MELSQLAITLLNSAVAAASIIALGLIRGTGATFVAGAKAGAEEGARTAIKNINWSNELRQELEKSRGVERQELRFKSYGSLWKKLRPLAIYSDRPLNRALFVQLNEELTDWYFSECGGMFLLPHARDLYFALQDFVRAVGKTDEWECRRTDGHLRKRFESILDRMELRHATAMMEELEKISKETSLVNWPERIKNLSEGWRADVQTLANRWNELDEADRFAVIQQIGSFLRTSLANDVESRLR